MFISIIKYEKIDERGAVKKATEHYLLEAMSFTEAEAKTVKEMEPFMRGEFLVHDIKRTNFEEVHEYPEGDRYFKCKLNLVTIDEEKGIEKKKAHYMLIQANDVKQARERVDEVMSDSVMDYEINGINETKIMDYFH